MQNYTKQKRYHLNPFDSSDRYIHKIVKELTIVIYLDEEKQCVKYHVFSLCQVFHCGEEIIFKKSFLHNFCITKFFLYYQKAAVDIFFY